MIDPKAGVMLIKILFMTVASEIIVKKRFN
jgi:hypothetical protein